MGELRVSKFDDDVKAALKSEAAKKKINYGDYVKEILAERAAKLIKAGGKQ